MSWKNVSASWNLISMGVSSTAPQSNCDRVRVRTVVVVGERGSQVSQDAYKADRAHMTGEERWMGCSLVCRGGLAACAKASAPGCPLCLLDRG